MIDHEAIFFLHLAVLLLIISFFISGWPAIGLLISAMGFAITAWILERHRRRVR